MFSEPTNLIFWSTLVCEFLVAFGLITYLAEEDKKQKGAR